MQLFVDHFIRYGIGYRNEPTKHEIHGYVLFIQDNEREHILTDGAVYSRWLCYWPNSPYGWEVTYAT